MRSFSTKSETWAKKLLILQNSEFNAIQGALHMGDKKNLRNKKYHYFASGRYLRRNIFIGGIEYETFFVLNLFRMFSNEFWED